MEARLARLARLASSDPPAALNLCRGFLKQQSRDAVEAAAVARVVADIADANKGLIEECRDILSKGLILEETEREANARVLDNLRYLHGYTTDNVTMPAKPIVERVRQMFEKNCCVVDHCGGYLQFLEDGDLPVDPDDAVVRSRQANLAPDATDAAVSAHIERVEAHRQHFVELQQHARADRVSRLMTRAVLLFAAYYVLMLLSAWFGPQAMEGETH